jgi:hypothetical protein
MSIPSVGDVRSDRNRSELVRLAHLYEFPDFVKQADFDAVGGPERLEAGACADQVHGLYNCDSKAATWLSAAYYLDKRAAFKPSDRARIEGRLRGFAEYWGIVPEYEAVEKRAAELAEAEAAGPPDSEFAAVFPSGRYGLMRDAAGVKEAAEWLYSVRTSLPFSQRHEIADRILEKAAAYGAALGAGYDEFLERQAGRGVCDPDRVTAMLRDRGRLVKSAAMTTKLFELANAIDNQKRRFCHPDNLVKLAELVDGIDRDQGLVGRYSQAIPAPEDVLFEATFTKAAGELATKCELTSGSCYDKTTLAKVALDDVRSLFGDEFADSVRRGLEVDPEKMAQLVHTLPRPDAELFDAMMGDLGLHPTLRKTSSDVRIGLTDAELNALAASYGGLA